MGVGLTGRRLPGLQAMAGAGWLGMTACPSWHRRRGWSEALGVEATDSAMAGKKWGAQACFTIIDVDERRLMAAP